MNDLSIRLERRFSRWLERHVKEHIQRRSITVAVERFSKLHPHWYDSCFDRSFIDRFSPGAFTDLGATAMATEWTRQFNYRNERRRATDIRQLTPVAESFLTILAEAKAELSSGEEVPRRRDVKRVGECAGALNR
ncbi:MAG: hypothetical protein WD314_14210 [Trueperaceae bacterium]